MPTVRELTEPYGNILLNPLPPSADVCRVCLTFTYGGYATCYRCGHGPEHADMVLPISYSPSLGQLHYALRSYKRLSNAPAQKFRLDLAAILWRFVDHHERCLARAMGVDGFELVTTVPAGARKRDVNHPLREIAGRVVQPTAARFDRLLARTAVEVPFRTISLEKFETVRPLDGEPILLIDDTWTTGSSVQSAAGTLKGAGAGPVGVIVIGRHVRRDHREDDERLKALPRPFDWDSCALEE